MRSPLWYGLAVLALGPQPLMYPTRGTPGYSLLTPEMSSTTFVKQDHSYFYTPQISPVVQTPFVNKKVVRRPLLRLRQVPLTYYIKTIPQIQSTAWTV